MAASATAATTAAAVTDGAEKCLSCTNKDCASLNCSELIYLICVCVVVVVDRGCWERGYGPVVPPRRSIRFKPRNALCSLWRIAANSFRPLSGVWKQPQPHSTVYMTWLSANVLVCRVGPVLTFASPECFFLPVREREGGLFYVESSVACDVEWSRPTHPRE